MSLIGRYPWLMYKVLFSGDFSLMIWKSQGCCLKRPCPGKTHVFFPLPFSNLVAIIVVPIFFWGDAKFIVKEIWADLLIASDTELSIVLFTGPEVFKRPLFKRQYQKQNQYPNQSKLQTTDSSKKQETNTKYLTCNIFHKALYNIY